MTPGNSRNSPLQGQKIVVTGGRGFIGSRLIEALVQQGAIVTALVRTGHESGRLRRLGAKVVVAALKPGRGLQDALTGQEVLVNTVYDFRAGMADNMAAFEALFDAAHSAGIRRFIHASSIVVYDDWPNGKISETSKIMTETGGDYRQAKIAMENKLLDSSFEVAVLQPTIVYGSGSALWTVAPMAALSAGGVVLPIEGGNCAAVHVLDVVQAFVKAAEVSDLKQEKFVISGADQPSWLELYQGYAKLTGGGRIELEPAEKLLERLGPESSVAVKSAPSVAARVSANLRRVVGNRGFEKIVGIVRKLRPQNSLRYPDRHLLKLLTANPEISIQLARTRLGYDPVFDLRKGLREIGANSGELF